MQWHARHEHVRGKSVPQPCADRHRSFPKPWLRCWSPVVPFLGRLQSRAPWWRRGL